MLLWGEHHQFIIKTLNEIDVEGTYCNIIKATYDNPTTNIMINGEKLKAFLLSSGTSILTLATYIWHSILSPCHSN